jgi:hypothetical protein
MKPKPATPPTTRPPVWWKVGANDIRIQVHEPEQAAALSRVAGVRLVGVSVIGPYLRIFGASKPPRWAKSYIHRLTRTNERFLEPAAP